MDVDQTKRMYGLKESGNKEQSDLGRVNLGQLFRGSDL